MQEVINNVIQIMNTSLDCFGVTVTLFGVICYCCIATLLLRFVISLFD